MIESGGIGIIFCIGTVGDHEDLHKLVKAACRPEAVPLIAVDLVEGFTDGNATALQFNMDHRQTVDEDRDVIAVIVSSTLSGGHGILIDDLQNIVVDILFVNEGDILAFAVITLQHLYMVFLNESGLFRNAQIRICKHFTEKTLPFAIGEFIPVQFGKLSAQVGHKVSILVNMEIFIAQLLKQPNELLFKLCLALVSLRALCLGLVFGYDCAFAALRNDVEITHFSSPPVVDLIIPPKNTNWSTQSSIFRKSYRSYDL